MKWLWIAVACLLVVAGAAGAQTNHAVFTSGGPFDDGSGTGTLLPAGTLVYLIWDLGTPGPDSADITPCGPGRSCYPEDPWMSYTVFFLGANGDFTSPRLGYSPPTFPASNTFYLAIFFGDNGDSCYTSPPLGLTGVPSSIQVINLPRPNWTCGPAQLLRPGSYDSLAISFGITGNDTVAYCLPVDLPEFNFIAVSNIDRNPQRPPLLSYTPGCAAACDPVDSVWVDAASWGVSPIDSTWYTLFAAYGGACVTLQQVLESPAVRLDTFTVAGYGNNFHVEWRTTMETGLDRFHLRRRLRRLTPPQETSWMDVTILPQNSATGAGYVYEDTISHPYSVPPLAYLLEAVTISGETYPLYVEHIDSSNWTAVEPHLAALPKSATLLPAYPNPFNATTRLAFELDRTAHVKLEILNLLGQRVAILVDAPQTAGRHEVTFSGDHLSSGVYLCRLQTGTIGQHQKLLLLK